MNNDSKALTDAWCMPTYGRFDVAFKSGRGATLVGEDGREYIDFGSGIGVNSLGAADPEWVAAVQAQAARIAHVSNLYYQEQPAALAAQLCALTGMARVFLGNSGAEANECAIKLARKYSRDTHGPGRATIVSLNGSFHGRTMATLSATGQDAFHTHFDPFPLGFVSVPVGDMAALEAADDGTVCAVLVECIQGEGGVVPVDAGYLRQVRALCDARGWLLMADEVQTGMGRTGRVLACEALGVRPDVVTLAKGLGGGLPIGACLCSEALADVLGPGTHGSTFGGNPVVCAGARVVLDRLAQPGFLDEVARKGAWLREQLDRLPGVCHTVTHAGVTAEGVRGLGLMLGFAPPAGMSARETAEACLARGLLVLTAKTAVRLLPPLVISDDELVRGVAILKEIYSERGGQPS